MMVLDRRVPLRCRPPTGTDDKNAPSEQELDPNRQTRCLVTSHKFIHHVLVYKAAVIFKNQLFLLDVQDDYAVVISAHPNLHTTIKTKRKNSKH